ncbi:hypothetical protein ASF65_20495 [Aureimonas sp. Leaf324]|nr:hypothetical protein ASF65_20495 [Aureimonas sp. Leaf324]
MFSNESALNGTWGSFETWILQKVEASRPISLAADRLREEALRLDRLDGYAQRDQIAAQKKTVLQAIDALERAILEHGRLTPEASFLF